MWSCAVYDDDLVSSKGGLAGSDGNASAGSSTTGKTSGGGGGTGASDGTQAGGVSGGAEVVLSAAGADNEGGESSSVGGAGSESGSAGTGSGGSGGTSGSGDSGGAGGTAPVATCGDHPIPLKSMWLASASSSSLGNGTEDDYLFNPPAHMIDSNNDERWSSGKNQGGDEWIQVDFGVVVALTDLTLYVNYNSTNGYPRAYAVRISHEPLDFMAPIEASGAGLPGSTVIKFETPLVGRYLTVRQTGVNDPAVPAWWSITELLVGCVD